PGEGHAGTRADERGYGQELAAAEGPAADADAAQHLRLVAHADLAQLDAVAEDRGEVLDELAEVHAPVGGEEKGYLVPLKAALDVYELHVEAVVLDLLFADAEGLALAVLVYLRDAQVVFRGDAHHGADGRDDF